MLRLYIKRKEWKRGLAEAALVVMDGCGHYAFLDKPKQFVAIAEAYLKPTDQEG